MTSPKGQVSVVLGEEIYEVVRYLQYKWKVRSAGEVLRRLMLMSPDVQQVAKEINLTLPESAALGWGGSGRKGVGKDESKEEA